MVMTVSDDKSGAAPERRCLVTGQSGPAANLIRFAVDGAGNIVPDIAGKLPGRGYWLTANRETVDIAVRKGHFQKAVARVTGQAKKAGKQPVYTGPIRVSPDLGALCETLLARHALDILGLARRTGLVTLGFDAVREALQADPAVILVTAADGSADGRNKLWRPGRPVVTLFTRDELSLALGRENVVHAALAPQGLGLRFMSAVERLAGFRPEYGQIVNSDARLKAAQSDDIGQN